jgi:hypothetical protein
MPARALAHDAFGDLGPFYANLLHPLADPLQAVLLLGAAALIAGRPLDVTRTALACFGLSALVGYLALIALPEVEAPRILFPGITLLVGLGATLSRKHMPNWILLPLVAAAGGLTGTSADFPAVQTAYQAAAGTILGLCGLVILAWLALDVACSKGLNVVSRVVGSWVAAIAVLVFALEF